MSRHRQFMNQNILPSSEKCVCNLLPGPTLSPAISNPPISNPSMLRKLRGTHSHPLILKPAVGTLIALLLCLCCPPAVLLAVPSVVVDPINGVVHRRTLPHVGNEVLKNMPLLTHGYVSLGIPPSFQRFVTGDTRTHVLPAAISPTLHPCLPGPGLPMNCFGPANHFSHLTSAGHSGSLTQGAPVDGFLYTAFTPTEPVNIPMSIFMCSPDYGQKSKCLTCKVFDVWVKRGNDILVLAHAVDGLSSSEHPALNTLGARAFYGTKHQASIAI